MPQKLTTEIMEAAIAGFEAQKRRIDEQIAELRQLMSGEVPAPAETAAPAGRPRRKMSAAGRKRIAEAQRKRWADARKDGSVPPKAPAKTGKRRLSPEGRRRIIEATKKRWAAVRAAAAAKAK
jgi:hypothetical protein